MKIRVYEAKDHFKMGLAASRSNLDFAIVTPKNINDVVRLLLYNLYTDKIIDIHFPKNWILK